MSKESKSSLYPLDVILVIHFLAGPPILAVVFYLSGNTGLGHVFSGMFIAFSLLYWVYGRHYIEIGVIGSEAEHQNVGSKSTTRRILHIYVVLNFLLGTLLWAAINYWVGNVFWGNASVGIFFLWSTLYWFYGVDYFKVECLQKLKNGKKIHNNTSA